MAIVEDIDESLSTSGIDRLVIVNGHGGNYALKNAVQRTLSSRPRRAMVGAARASFDRQWSGSLIPVHLRLFSDLESRRLARAGSQPGASPPRASRTTTAWRAPGRRPARLDPRRIPSLVTASYTCRPQPA
jgi:hypothetical protein